MTARADRQPDLFAWAGSTTFTRSLEPAWQPRDDGSLEIEVAFHHGDEAVLKTVRESSPTA